MKKILVVDDEKDLCILVARYLDRVEDYEVLSTSDPTEVMELCLGEQPDLIILDLVMPGVDGRDIILQLKKDSRTSSILIIVTSGLGEMVYHELGEKWRWEPNRSVVKERSDDLVKEKSAEKAADSYGVDDFIAKPFAPSTLLAVVSEVFKKNEEKGDDE